MKVSSGSITRRRTHGPYEHEEITLHAEFTQDFSLEQQLADLRSRIETALYAEVTLPPVTDIVAPVKTSTLTEEVKPPVAKPAPVEKKAKAAKKEKIEAPSDSEEMEEVESPYKEEATKKEESSKHPKGTVYYDKEVKEHRSRLATYLGTNIKDWKTKKTGAEIAEFSTFLTGRPFEDSKGNMLDTFKTSIKDFFA